MDDEKGANWFQIGIAAAGVIVTALLGYGQWQLSQQQNRMLSEQHLSEEKRASETNMADKEKSADNIEVQVMTMVAPYLSKLRGSGKEAETSQKVVLAAANYLSSQHKRTALAEMYHRIVEDSPSVKPEIKAQIAEATEPVIEGSPWYAVLASLSVNELSAARDVANEKLRVAEQIGLPQGVKIYKTRISNDYAVVIGGQMARSDALALVAAAKQKRLSTDAFAQQDRSWTFVGDAPFK
jgi:hypothetical protein